MLKILWLIPAYAESISSLKQSTSLHYFSYRWQNYIVMPCVHICAYVQLWLQTETKSNDDLSLYTYEAWRQ